MERCVPSLLDYCMATPGLVTSSCLYWKKVPADHALMSCTLAVGFPAKHHKKNTFQCSDEGACVQWLSERCPGEFTSASDLHDLLAAQARWDESLTCAQRRQRRMPLQLRDLYRRCAHANTEGERKVLQKQAWEMRKRWVQSWKTAKLRESVRRGGVLTRTKKLHRVDKLVQLDSNSIVRRRRAGAAAG